MSSLTQRMKEWAYDPRGGWVDGTARYADTVRKHVRPGARVLDIGPGGGGSFSHARYLGGCHIVGLDPDPCVRGNPALAEAVVAEAEDMPFEDASFDAAVSNYVLEHVEDPSRAAKEICRVLKPGGVFVFRTPNLWHYSTFLSRIVPDRLHGCIASWAKGKETRLDAFPTTYRCNTRRAIRRAFCRAGFIVLALEAVESEPSYMQFSPVSFLAGVVYERVVNRYQGLWFLRANICGALKKPCGRSDEQDTVAAREYAPRRHGSVRRGRT